MSTRSLIARVSTIESNVDTLQSKADSENAVLTGTTSINGPVLLNGPVSLTSTINGITKTMVGLGNVNNTSDKDKPLSDETKAMFETVAKAVDITINKSRQIRPNLYRQRTRHH